MWCIFIVRLMWFVSCFFVCFFCKIFMIWQWCLTWAYRKIHSKKKSILTNRVNISWSHGELRPRGHLSKALSPIQEELGVSALSKNFDRPTSFITSLKYLAWNLLKKVANGLNSHFPSREIKETQPCLEISRVQKKWEKVDGVGYDPKLHISSWMPTCMPNRSNAFVWEQVQFLKHDCLKVSKRNLNVHLGEEKSVHEDKLFNVVPLPMINPFVPLANH